MFVIIFEKIFLNFNKIWKNLSMKGVPNLLSSASLQARNAIYRHIKYVCIKYNIFTWHLQSITAIASVV